MQCPKCGGTKFYNDRAKKKRRCAECQKERMRKIYATDEYKRKHRIADRKRKRRCSETFYNTLLGNQNGRCAICGDYKGYKLRMDHCHKTGKLRKLLCDNCNWGLGNFKDDVSILQEAIKYLISTM